MNTQGVLLKRVKIVPKREKKTPPQPTPLWEGVVTTDNKEHLAVGTLRAEC